MKIVVTLEDTGVSTLLSTLQQKLSDLSEPMRDIAVYMKEEVMENFEQEGRPTRWPPLAESTIRHKLKVKGVVGQILEFHGRLKQSINTIANKNEAAVFTGVFYGVYHQTGTRRMPRRAFMPYSDNDGIPPFHKEGIENIKEILTDHLRRAVTSGV